MKVGLLPISSLGCNLSEFSWILAWAFNGLSN